MNKTIVITRHASLVQYLKEKGIIAQDAEVITHASPEAVIGNHVVGVLSHSLSCLCASFTEIPMNLPPEKRGMELSIDDVYAYAQEPVTYRVSKLERGGTE